MKFDSVLPKNVGLSQELIKMAESKAKDDRERTEIEYFKYRYHKQGTSF